MLYFIPAVLMMVCGCLAAFTLTLNLLWPRLGFLEVIFMSPALGLSATAWLALLIKSIPIVRKGVAPEVVGLTIGVQVLVILANFRGTQRRMREGAARWKKELEDHRSALIMLGVMSVWWYYMSYIHYLLPKGSEHITGGSVYADLPFHLNLTTSFLYGCNEWATVFSSLMSSFFAGVTLAYPFLPDFLISVLVAGGMTLRWGLVFTGWLLLTSLFSLIHMFNFRLSGSVRVGMLSVWLTLFAGGIGAFYYVAEKPDWYTWDNLTNSVFQHGPDHVLYWVKGMSAYWFSLPAHILFPQRTVQHAYPLAVSAMLCIWAGMMACPPPPPTIAGKGGAGGGSAGGSSTSSSKSGGGSGANGGGVSTTGGAASTDTGEQRALKEIASTPRRSLSRGQWAGEDSPPTSSSRGDVTSSTSSAISHATSASLKQRRAGGGGGRGSSHDASGAAGAAGAGAGGAGAGAGGGISSPTPTGPASTVSGAVGAGTAQRSEFEVSMQVRLFAFGGFLTALIPLMQPHSYVSIGIVLLVAAGLQTLSIMLAAALGTGALDDSHYLARYLGKAEWRDVWVTVYLWTVYGLVAISLGAPQFLKHFVHRVTFGVGTRGNGFVRFSPATDEEGKGETIGYMWWKALGMFMPLFLASFLLLRTRQQRAFWCGFLTLFITCNFVMFQPWHLDNTKLFYIFVFGASGYVALTLDTILSATANREGSAITSRLPPGLARFTLSWLGWAVAVAGFFVLTFSGAMATWREMLNHAKLYDDIDFDVAEWIKEKTPTDAIFLHDITQSNHIRIESSLAGRQVAHGFAGWLHSHGINSEARRVDLTRVLQGEEGAVAALRKHNVSYITVDAGSKSNFNYAFLDDTTDFVATNGKYSIYKVLDSVRLGKWRPKPCEGVGAGASKQDCLAAQCWYFGPNKCESKPRTKKVEDCQQTSQDACRAVGCIWQAYYPGPWCQKPAWGKPADIPMLRPGQPGSDCGWHNMGIQDCIDKGCVWRTPSDPYFPYCTFPKNGEKPGQY